ncbi:MAG: phosphoadenylyl-sulfate reductase [Pseudomonadota bacterium]
MTTSLGRLQNFYGELDAKLLLHAMIKQEFSGNIALLTSFGSDSGLLLAMVAEVDVNTPILFLETGKHFPETLAYGRTLEKQFGLKNVIWLKPDEEMLARIDSNGELWKTQPNRCCWLRKVEPLNRKAEEMGLLAIITGRKRYQTPERANMNNIELDEDGMFRINPLANWSKEQQKEAIIHYNIPPHPLLAKGYLSIGCEPCTLPVKEGQDERAGRWAHTIGVDENQKTECGIHLPSSDMNWSV